LQNIGKDIILVVKSNKINVFIISPQVLFRSGIEIVLASVENLRIMGSTDFSDGVPFSLDQSPPDVAILDINSSLKTGIEMAKMIKQRLPNISIIMFTSNLDDDHVFQALQTQAAACLSKEATSEEIIDTVKRVARGEYPINDSLQTRPKVAEHVLEQFQKLSMQRESQTLISPITVRETEILQYIAQGFLNKQIAAELEISEQTIKNHVTSILRKLNANARTEAVVIALKQGIISLD
jgi:DNA-binding NarL/FixJ family response regulator